MSPGKNLATQTYKFIDGYPKRKCFSKLKTSLLMLVASIRQAHVKQWNQLRKAKQISSFTWQAISLCQTCSEKLLRLRVDMQDHVKLLQEIKTTSIKRPLNSCAWLNKLSIVSGYRLFANLSPIRQKSCDK